MNSNIFTSIVVPFARFMVLSLKFSYEFSPFGILSYASKAERAALMAGDVEKAARFAIGVGMTGAAIEIRERFGGEKWYEINLPNGEVFDARPFAPLSTYLFIAYVTKKMIDGDLQDVTAKDIIQGLASTNFRAGTGLAITDEFLEFLSTGIGPDFDIAKGFEKAGQGLGNLVAGFFTFMSPLRDAYDQYTDGRAIVRDTSQQPFLGPIKAKFPFFSQSLPEAEFPTRAGPKFFVDPVKRQATGLSVKGAKNPMEKELDRLGFKRSEILPGSGDKEVDREVARVMGPVVENFMSPIVTTQGYQKLSDGVKGLIISETIAVIRSEARKFVNENLPEEKQIKIQIKRLSRRTRNLLKEIGFEKRLKAK